MLVLSRKVGERLVMANGVIVTVIALRGSAVRLGIEAPPLVNVVRAELLGHRTKAPPPPAPLPVCRPARRPPSAPAARCPPRRSS